MPDKNDRIVILQKQLDEYLLLLKEWEHRLIAPSDPNDAYRAKQEVLRLKEHIKSCEEEIQALPQNKNSSSPFNNPTVRNKRKIILLIFIPIISAIAYWSYLTIGYTGPDYTKYLLYMAQGDSLVGIKKMNEARVAYNKAGEFNQKDPAVLRKLSLLDSTDRLIKENKVVEVANLAMVILSIQASPALSEYALKQEGIKSNPPLSISLNWNGAKLEIIISGGVPFADEKKPYLLEGISCSTCIEWKKNKSVYKGIVPGDKVVIARITLKDRLGQFRIETVPVNPYSVSLPLGNHPDSSLQTTPPVIKPGETREQSFSNTIKKGDSLFNKKDYQQAKNVYLSARILKPDNADVAKKIQACDAKLQEAQVAQAKIIPRITLPGGIFNMGNESGMAQERPLHAVKIGSFSLSTTEVTVAQYRSFCAYTGHPLPPVPSFILEDDQPIVNISWHDAVAYCTWVGGRLPTEAEWEYAAHAGESTKYSGSNQIDEVGFYNTNSRGKPGNVRKKTPNKLGFYDMTGNVYEWCQDWYASNYYSKSPDSNPKGPATGSERVIRGGSFASYVKSQQDANQLTVTYRNSRTPGSRHPDVGFRVAWN